MNNFIVNFNQFFLYIIKMPEILDKNNLYTILITLITLTCFFILYFGISFLKEPKYALTNTGTVIGLMNSKQVVQCLNNKCEDPVCKQFKLANTNKTSCSFRVMYTDTNGLINLSNIISNSPFEVKAGDNIPIFINKNDNLDVSLISDNRKSSGWFLIIIASCALLFVIGFNFRSINLIRNK